MRRAVVGVMVLLAVFTTGSAAADRPAFKVKTTLHGQEVPSYNRYHSLFLTAHVLLQDSDDIREHFLEKMLRIPAGGEAEAAFRLAVEKAFVLLQDGQTPLVSVEENEGSSSQTTIVGRPVEALEPSAFPSEEAYRAEVRRRERLKARQLGLIVGSLEASLEALGISPAGIESYVDGRLADSSTLLSSDVLHAEHHVFQIQQAFDTGRRLGRKGVAK